MEGGKSFTEAVFGGSLDLSKDEEQWPGLEALRNMEV